MSIFKYILAWVAFSALIIGLTSKFLPYIFLIVIALVVSYVYVLFKAIYKDFLIYKYYTINGEAHRADLAKDPCRFHISVIYVMAEMLRTDGDAVQADKLQMIIRYIHEACPAEYREIVVEALDYLTHREDGSGKSKDYYSVLNKDNIIKANGKSYLKNIDAEGRYENHISGWRMAEELGRYLSETDRMYVMYLLFSMAIANNSVSLGKKKDHPSEMVALQQLCVKGLKIPFETLKFLFEEWRAGRIRMWYENNIACKGRYPAYDAFADILEQANDNKSEFFELEKETVPTSNVGDVFSLLILNSFVLLVLCFVLGTQMKHLSLANLEDLGLISLCIIFIVLSILFIFLPQINKDRHSDVLHTLRTHKESTMQKRSLIFNTITAIVSSFVLWFGVTMLSYVCFNNNYTKGEIEKISYVEGTTVHHSSKHGDSYSVEMSTLEITPEDLQKCKTPHLTPLEQIESKVLPFISGAKFLPVTNELVSSEGIDYDLYDKLLSSEDDYKVVRLLKIGYYNLPFDDDLIRFVPLGQDVEEPDERQVDEAVESETPIEREEISPIEVPN